MNKKVLLGMSGGVDSSVSAIILQKQGYEVIGCTMILLENKESVKQTIQDAKKVCDKLNIEHYVFDFSKEFKELIIGDFINEYINARTPNPCVICNKYFKFGLLYDKAKELGCKYIATGHYAKIEYSEKYHQNILTKSSEIKKDQTYFLYKIQKEQLDQIIFPLQDFKSKDDIRKIAEENDLEVAKKKDSQEICFIQDNDYQKFLKENIKEKIPKGKVVLEDGKVLGNHNGLINYTIGQRKGLGIAYKEPIYVLGLDKEKNEIVVGSEKSLYSTKLELQDVNWLIPNVFENELECFVKIRYRAKEAKAKVVKVNEKYIVEFEEPQRAITKGQSAVFYDELGNLLGGGIILVI